MKKDIDVLRKELTELFKEYDKAGIFVERLKVSRDEVIDEQTGQAKQDLHVLITYSEALF